MIYQRLSSKSSEKDITLYSLEEWALWDYLFRVGAFQTAEHVRKMSIAGVSFLKYY